MNSKARAMKELRARRRARGLVSYRVDCTPSQRKLHKKLQDILNRVEEGAK